MSTYKFSAISVDSYHHLEIQLMKNIFLKIFVFFCTIDTQNEIMYEIKLGNVKRNGICFIGFPGRSYKAEWLVTLQHTGIKAMTKLSVSAFRDVKCGKLLCN
jgi:hypothetical protein